MKHLLISLIILPLLMTAQRWEYVRQSTGTGPEVGRALIRDNQGNIYITGNFNGTAIFGSFTLVSGGANDIFIAKYDPAGNCIWAKRAGGNTDDYGTGIGLDSSGNVYASGYFNGLLIFGTCSISSGWGMDDAYLCKFTPTGNCVWVKKWAVLQIQIRASVPSQIERGIVI